MQARDVVSGLLTGGVGTGKLPCLHRLAREVCVSRKHSRVYYWLRRPLLRCETAWVTNPTSGAKLKVYLVRTKRGSARLPAVVLIPGGTQCGQDVLWPPGGLSTAQLFAKAGLLSVTFDPDGRGLSGGQEDDGGTVQQDGLSAVMELLRRRADVDPDRIGIVSFSYGLTIAAGYLARYADSTPAKFLVDLEAPADRTDIGGFSDPSVGHLLGMASPDDEDYWQPREPVRHVARLRVPYQRVQMTPDHVQPDAHHALALLQAARRGGVPWVRLNDDPPNHDYRTLGDLRLPSAPGGSGRRGESVLSYVLDMMARFAPGAGNSGGADSS